MPFVARAIIDGIAALAWCKSESAELHDQTEGLENNRGGEPAVSLDRIAWLRIELLGPGACGRGPAIVLRGEPVDATKRKMQAA